MSQGTFAATTLSAQYYDSGSRYTPSAACQGARIRDDNRSHQMVGVIGIPSLGNVEWSDKALSAVVLKHIKATHITTGNYTNFYRLYRSKRTDYKNEAGSTYLDTSAGYTDITIDSVGSGDTSEHSANLSAANIAWLQASLKAGCTWFCIYYDESASSGFSSHFASASSWKFIITYDYQKYTISYNKGANGSGTNTTQDKTHNIKATLKGAIFTRQGYVQDGWSTTDGGAIAYALGAEYTTNAAITLYPHWEASISTVAASDGTLGSAVPITITRYSTAYTHTLSYKYGNDEGTIATDVGTSHSWTPPLSLAQQFTTATTGTCTITCTTYNGNELIGTSTVSIALAIPDTVKCKVGAVTLAETVSGLAAKFGAFVQGKSKIKVTAAYDHTDCQGGTVKSISIAINGQTLTRNEATTSEITSSGTLAYSITITDSRGRTDTKTGTYNVLVHAVPEVTVSAERSAATPSSIVVNYTFSIDACGDNNDKTIRISYKLRSAEYYGGTTTITPTNYSGSGSYTITGTDVNSAYDIKVEAVDYFGRTPAETKVASTGSRIVHLSRRLGTISKHGANPKDGYDHQWKIEIFHEGLAIGQYLIDEEAIQKLLALIET